MGVLGIIIGLIHVAKLSSFTFWNLHIICLTKCLTRCFICLSQFNGLCLLVLVTIGHLFFSFSHVHLGLLGDQRNKNLKLRLKKKSRFNFVLLLIDFVGVRVVWDFVFGFIIRMDFLFMASCCLTIKI